MNDTSCEGKPFPAEIGDAKTVLEAVAPSARRGYYVVLLTGKESPCERWEGRDCVMDVLGPYTKAEAEAVFLQQPEWAAPHIIVTSGSPDG